MEISVGSIPVPQQQVNQQSSTPAAQAGAVPTLQATPDNVVTAAVEPSDTNVRSDDAFRRSGPGNGGGGFISLDDIRIQGLATRIDFDPNTEKVYLEILQPQTDKVIRRIPSESLVEFLNESFEAVANRQSSSAIDTRA